MNLKRLRLVAAFLAVASASFLSHPFADAQSNEELEKRWQKKQNSKFLKAVEWERSLEAAVERARRDNLPIVAYFTRSYAP